MLRIPRMRKTIGWSRGHGAVKQEEGLYAFGRVRIQVEAEVAMGAKSHILANGQRRLAATDLGVDGVQRVAVGHDTWVAVLIAVGGAKEQFAVVVHQKVAACRTTMMIGGAFHQRSAWPEPPRD